MIQKSFIAIAFTLFVTLNFSIADDRQILSKDDDFMLTNKLDKILRKNDYQKLRPLDAPFMLPEDKYPRNLPLMKDYAVSADPWGSNSLSHDKTKNSVATLTQFISDWLNREEIVRKRAHHRALCHFKICNMGSKRSNWDPWSNEIQPTLIENI